MELAHELYSELADCVGGGEGRLTTYSGRGMYGDRCIAVIGGVRDLLSMWSGLHYMINVRRQDDAGLAEIADSDDLERVMVMMGADAREDSMGLDKVYYFPNVTVAVVPTDRPKAG